MALRFAAGLIVGIIVGGAAGAGGMWWYTHRQPAIAPVQPEAPRGEPPARGKKPRRTAAAARDSAGDDAPPVVIAADLAVRAEGDALRVAPATLDMAGGVEPRDLSQQEIDGTFASRADAIIACITAARGEAAVNGRVVAGVVVGADGRVVRSRIEAPAYLLDRGLARCARRELSSLRFPAPGREAVVTVPFDVRD